MKFVKQNIILGIKSVKLFSKEGFEDRVKVSMKRAKLRSEEENIELSLAIKKNFREVLLGQLLLIVSFSLFLISILAFNYYSVPDYYVLPYLTVGFFLFTVLQKSE